MARATKLRTKARAPEVRRPVPFAERTGVHIALLILLSLGIYAASLANGFIGDDSVQVLNNPLIRDWQRIPEMFRHSVWAFNGADRDNYYRPVHFLIYMAVYYLAGLEAWAYHLLMLVMHTVATVLVYLLARRWLAGWQAPLLAGAVFALHPIHSEAVLWIASVPDVATTILVLAAIYLFIACHARPGLWGAIAIALFYFAALLSKETGAMLLPLLVGCELLLLRRRFRDLPADTRLYAALAAVSAVYLLLRYHALGGLAPAQGVHFRLTAWQLFLTGSLVAAKYLLKLVLPLHLSYWYVIDPVSVPNLLWLVAFAACLSVVAAILVLRYRGAGPGTAAEPLERRARVSFFIFFFAVPILPALNLNGINASPFGERYLYLPSAGLAMLAGELWNLLLPRLSPRRRRLAWGAALLVLCAASVQILTRIPDWRNEKILLTRSIEQLPGCASLHQQLGQLLANSGEIDAAQAHYRTALQLKPSAMLHVNLGGILVLKQQYADAIRELRSALALDPTLAGAHADLGSVLAGTGELPAAAAEYNQALRLQPNNAQALTGLGMIEYNENHKEEAATLYRRAIDADPRSLGAHIGLGQLCLDQQRYQEAATEFRRAIQLAPDTLPLLPDLHYDLGVAYLNLSQAEEAIEELQIAIRLRPDYEAARQLLLEIQDASAPAATPRPPGVR